MRASSISLVKDIVHTHTDVLQQVASDHIKGIDRTRHIQQYLLDVLKDGENVPKAEFEGVNADVECELHADVYYQRFSFSAAKRTIRIEGPNIDGEIESITEDLRS